MKFGLNILVDVGVLLILLWGYQKAKKTQFFTELFSLLGVFFTIIISLQYYIQLSDYIVKRFLIPEQVSQISIFIFLVIFLGFSITIGFESLVAVFKLEAHPWLDKWGGLLLGMIKYYCIVGLVFLGLFITHHRVVIKAANNSYSQYILRYTATGIYDFSFNRLLVKLIPNMRINTEVFTTVQESILK